MINRTGSVLIGLLVGCVIIIVIVIALYSSKSSYFNYCIEPNYCTEDDYVETAEAMTDSTNYWTRSDAAQHVRRPVKPGRACFPDQDQNVPIPQPQHCKVNSMDPGGTAPCYYELITLAGNGSYRLAQGGCPENLTMGENCFSTEYGQGFALSPAQFNQRL